MSETSSDFNNKLNNDNIDSEQSDENEVEKIKNLNKDSINDLMKTDYSYPEQTSKNLQYDMYKKKEFYNNRIHERAEFKTYEEIKNYRDNIGCAHMNDKPTKPHPYQNLLVNFINPLTPYKGIIIMHGLGSGKTRTGVSIAENFIPQCQKYRTKIVVLVPGPILKENWKKEILHSTGEKYLKYIDKSLIINKEDKDKLNKNAISLILQYYRFMSYKSFYKHVLGEKIIDKKVLDDSTKIKNVYRKNEEGEFERDLSADRIYNLNNSLLIVDEAHQLTGNEYGEAVKYIINNSMNLKVVLLTATPMKNLAHDIVELVNFLRPKNSLMERDKIFSFHKNYQMEFKEGGKEYLRKMMSGYFSYVRGADPLTYATRGDQGKIPKGLFFTKVTQCKMGEFQKKVYDITVDDQTKELDDIEEGENVEESKKDSLDRKSEAVSNFVFPGLSSDKKTIVGYYGREGVMLIKNQLKENSLLLNKKISNMLYGHENETDLLYISHDGRNLTGKIYKKENLKTFSTKFHRALTKIKSLVWGKTGAKTAFIYSNLVKVGIDIFQEILLQNGFLEYQEDEQNYQISPDTVCYYCGIKHEDHGNISRNYIKRMSNKKIKRGINSESESESTSSISMSSIPDTSEQLDDDMDDSEEYNEQNIPIHQFYPATFISITGKSSEDTVDVIPEEKKKILDHVFNNISNKDGKYIKLVLGSKVMNEGVSLQQVGEVHILDVYFNLGKVDQAVGRAIRYCSHYHLMSEQNQFPVVKVYKYVVSLDDKLSTEEQLYKKAELKYILIKEVERVIKETAIDCALNLNGNIFKEEVEKYKNCENEGEYKCPARCDYMSCEYKCGNERLNAEYYDPARKIYRKLLKHELDTTTFNNELARNEIDNAKEKIKDLFIMNYSYTLADIVEYVKNEYDEDKKDLFDEFFVYKALDELIPITENDFNNFKDTIVDKHHRQGYLIYRKNYYIFQPFEQNENTPMYYRTNVDKKLTLDLSMYNYLKMTDQLQQQIDLKSKKQTSDIEDQFYYDFDAAMDYYDSRNEYEFVGFIDKEVSRRKSKSLDEIDDIFKLREKRAKILDKKRATGLPSLKGAVCLNAKSKDYLIKVAKKLGVELSKPFTRTDICGKIEKKMLHLEKYSTEKDDNKLTYIMIPANHPHFPFPYNLEDRTTHIINEFHKGIKTKLDISTKTIKKTEGSEKGLPSYIISIKHTDKIKDKHDVNVLEDLIKKYKGKKHNKDYEILVE
jgi:Type III restriction enzyme, res subunit